MRVYLDTSAAVKLFIDETESAALMAYLDSMPGAAIFSSTLVETEARRTALRRGATQSDVTALLSSVNLFDMTKPLLHEAGLVPPAELRSLDAIHLVTAERYGATVLVSYDHRLSAAANARGIPTASPA